MIALSLPNGGNFGWGVCGANLTRELKALTMCAEAPTDNDYPFEVICPCLHAIQGANLLPIRPNFWSSTRNVGYSFVENHALAGRYALNAVRHFDLVVAGSSWCTRELKKIGLIDVVTAIQGVSNFFFDAGDRRLPPDRFIVLSAGKAETRKGQDLVVAAMKIFMERRSDAFLAYQWNNQWRTDGYERIVSTLHRTLPSNRLIGPGIREITHREMPAFYLKANVGLFPNRAEAGTNLPMMEAMATGLPVIATYATGHTDVLDEHSPLSLTNNKPLLINGPDGKHSGTWVEPELDEIVAKLDYAYDHRDGLFELGQKDSERMRQWTWERCARQFLAHLGQDAKQQNQCDTRPIR